MEKLPDTSDNRVKPPQQKIGGNNLDRSKYIYELVNGWILNADNKVSVSCAVSTMVFGVVAFLAENIANMGGSAIHTGLEYGYMFSFFLSMALIAGAIFFYMWAIIPNLKSNKSKEEGEKNYPIYYGDICSLDKDRYRALMIDATDSDFIDELIWETHFNSEICMKKMQRYRCGVMLSIFAIACGILSVVFRFLMYH